MNRHQIDHIPVVDQGRLLGMLSKEDLAKWLSLRTEREQGDELVGGSAPTRR